MGLKTMIQTLTVFGMVSANAHILVGGGDSIKCDSSSKAYNDKVVCLPEFSTNYEPSYFYGSTVYLAPGEVADCGYYENSGKKIACSDRGRPTDPGYPPEPQPEPKKLIDGLFTYKPNLACFQAMPNNLVAYKDIVGSGLFKSLKGKTESCDDRRLEARSSSDKFDRKRRGRGGRFRYDEPGVREARYNDFMATDCQVEYLDLDQACYDSIMGKAAPNSWDDDRRSSPKDGQRSAVRDACSTKEIYCYKEVELTHPAKGRIIDGLN